MSARRIACGNRTACVTHPARAYGERLLFSSCATVLSQPHFLRDVLRQRAVTQTAQLPQPNEECGEGNAHGVGHLFDSELVRRPQNAVPIYGDAVCASVHGNYIANHEAGHQKGCAHAINLRLPKAEQVFEILLRIGTFSVKLTVKGGAGNRPVHDVVGALVADGEAPSAAFVLPPQAALDYDGSSGIHAPDNGPVLVDAQRGHAVRNEADLVAVLLGKASVQQGQLQKVRNEYILVLYIDLALSNKYILIKPLSAVENSHALWYHICRVSTLGGVYDK